MSPSTSCHLALRGIKPRTMCTLGKCSISVSQSLSPSTYSLKSSPMASPCQSQEWISNQSALPAAAAAAPTPLCRLPSLSTGESSPSCSFLLRKLLNLLCKPHSSFIHRCQGSLRLFPLAHALPQGSHWPPTPVTAFTVDHTPIHLPQASVSSGPN